MSFYLFEFSSLHIFMLLRREQTQVAINIYFDIVYLINLSLEVCPFFIKSLLFLRKLFVLSSQ